tara:strand:+ start:5202 stop:5807 length:606 start_codon:yes stop_codon:yes gene_type:complete
MIPTASILDAGTTVQWELGALAPALIWAVPAFTAHKATFEFGQPLAKDYARDLSTPTFWPAAVESLPLDTSVEKQSDAGSRTMEQEAVRSYDALRTQAHKTEAWLRILGVHHSIGVGLLLPHTYIKFRVSHDATDLPCLLHDTIASTAFSETRLLGYAMLREAISREGFCNDQIENRQVFADWETRPQWARELLPIRKKKL